MATVVCKLCPFRSDSPLGYDADAMEALDNDCIPACHEKVGMDAIFHQHVPTDDACIGHECWCQGNAGFSKPALTPKPCVE